MYAQLEFIAAGGEPEVRSTPTASASCNAAHGTHTLESKGEALCVCGIRCIVKRAYGVKYTLVPSAVAPLYLRPNQADPT